jgi:hypothetical protein
MSAKAIEGDKVIAEDMPGRVRALRHFLKQVDHTI